MPTARSRRADAPVLPVVGAGVHPFKNVNVPRSSCRLGGLWVPGAALRHHPCQCFQVSVLNSDREHV